MASNIKEQDESVVKGLTENEAAGDYLNNIGSLIKEHSLLNAPQSYYEVVGDVLRLGLPDEDENIAQVSNVSVNLMTPLHVAALQGHAEDVRNLIDHGADVHAKDIHGCTALHIAAQKGDYPCLKMLIEAGSDAFAPIGMSCKATAFSVLGASALITALQNDHLDCIQKLLLYGVDSSAVDEKGNIFRHVVAKKAISNCIPDVLKSGIRQYYHGVPFIPPSFKYSIMQCFHKLLLIGSLNNNTKSSGILELCKFICTGIEDVDAEIFKVFFLESYYIDRNIPRGLTTLRHFGSDYYNSKIAAILITCFTDIFLDLIQYLLSIFGRFRTFKFVAECILWVPHLVSLTTLPCKNKLPKHQFGTENLENFILPHNVTFEIECVQTCIYVSIHDREKELNELELPWSEIVSGTPKYGQYPLKQPLIDLIDDRISNEIDQLNFIVEHKHFIRPNNFGLKRSYLLQLWNLKKYLWCEKIASYPPTLSQCCRYSLLKCLGPLNVENIRKLPLPKELKSYLLFQ